METVSVITEGKESDAHKGIVTVGQFRNEGVLYYVLPIGFSADGEERWIGIPDSAGKRFLTISPVERYGKPIGLVCNLWGKTGGNTLLVLWEAWGYLHIVTRGGAECIAKSVPSRIPDKDDRERVAIMLAVLEPGQSLTAMADIAEQINITNEGGNIIISQRT